MTRTVEDTAYMLQAIAGRDARDPTSSTAPVPDYSLSLREDIRGVTIGVPRHFFFSDDPSVNQEGLSTVDKGLQVLEDLGANLVEVTIPSLEYVRAANTIIMLSEAYAYHEKNLKTRPQDFGEMVRDRFRIGGLFQSSDYVQSLRCRQIVKKEFAQVFQQVDLLVSPTMTQPVRRVRRLRRIQHSQGSKLYRPLQPDRTAGDFNPLRVYCSRSAGGHANRGQAFR